MKEVYFDAKTKELLVHLDAQTKNLQTQMSVICCTYLRAKNEEEESQWKLKEDFSGMEEVTQK